MYRQLSSQKPRLAIILTAYTTLSASRPIPELGTTGLTLGSTTVSNGMTQSVPTARNVETVLAAIALLLIAGTYFLIIKSATALVSLPSKPVQENIQSLLNAAWPIDIGRCTGPLGRDPNDPGRPRDLLYLGLMKDDHVRQRAIKGVTECQANAKEPVAPQKRLISMRNESSAVMNVLRLALWEWISVWLVIIMFVNTVVNNFIIGESNPDRYPRLALMLIYAVAFLLHSFYAWTCFFRVYTCLVLNGCWTLLGNAEFAVADRRGTFRKLRVFSTSILGPTQVLKAYKIGSSGSRKVAVEDTDNGGNQAQDSIRSTQKSEIKNFEDAAKAALDRIIFNTTLILGIAVVTSFSTWTQSQLYDATSTQLGSIALLTSTSSGIGAMLSSTVNLSIMKTSSWRFLRITELIMGGQTEPDERTKYIGFTMRNKFYHSVTLRDFWYAMSISQIPWALVFGPAFVLLSSRKESSQNSNGKSSQNSSGESSQELSQEELSQEELSQEEPSHELAQESSQGSSKESSEESFRFSVQLDPYRVVFTTGLTNKHFRPNKLNVYLDTQEQG